MEPQVLALLIIACISLSIFLTYYIIKLAVRDGIIAADVKQSQLIPYEKAKVPKENMSTAQLSLYEKYEKGELTIEEYQKRWNEVK